MHGFDEFFGNLYHLNAEEEPEHPDYPDPEHYPKFRERFGPRGLLQSKMTRTGKHTVKDSGPLTRKRMETIDDEIVDGAIDFIERKHRARTPFFVWIKTTHMHLRTSGRSGRGTCPAARGRLSRSRSAYCLAIAIWRRSSGLIRWSVSSAAASTSICTQRTLPLNWLSLGL
jgi:arylsulfatase A-like enzyme